MIVLKDDDLRSVNQEFATLSKLQPENRFSWRTGKGAKIRQDFRWADDISYLDSNSREHSLSVIECLETKPLQGIEEETTKFKWITNYKVSCQNVATLSNDGGRIRWKIENEGFNVQKNGGYGLEHAYSNHPNSAKIFYLLLQIAHLLAQLTRETFSKIHSPKGLVPQRTLRFGSSKPGETLRSPNSLSKQSFKPDSKSALIPLNQSSSSSPFSPVTI